MNLHRIGIPATAAITAGPRSTCGSG